MCKGCVGPMMAVTGKALPFAPIAHMAMLQHVQVQSEAGNDMLGLETCPARWERKMFLRLCCLLTSLRMLQIPLQESNLLAVAGYDRHVNKSKCCQGSQL